MSSLNETEKELIEKLEPEKKEEVVARTSVTLPKDHETSNQENEEINKMLVTVRELEDFEDQENRRLSSEPMVRL